MGLRSGKKDAKIVEDTNEYLQDAKKGMELCANIISVGEFEYEEELSQIEEILKEFTKISQEDTNTTGVETYKALTDIKDEIINIINFPELENHYTVALGGSFSSGKSSFLNTVLGLDNILPTDTNPSTSISSYIVKSDKDRYVALNNFKNKISLNKEAILAVSHSFYEEYKLSFSHILKLILIEQKNLRYDNLVFLDTPGYSKPDSQKSQNNIDENIAREHLRGADFIIWLVDSQAPISADEMKFLKSLSLQHPILVVLNRADMKISKDIESLIASTRENLEAQKIPFYDVVGYDSLKNREYSPTQDVVQSYLSAISSQTRGTKILRKIEDVFSSYINFYESQLLEYRVLKGVLNKIELTTLDEEFLEPLSKLSKKRDQQIQYIKSSKKIIHSLKERLEELVKHILEEKNISQRVFSSKKVFDDKFYNNIHKGGSFFTFPVKQHLNNREELMAFKDLHSLEAEVTKVSSLGIFFALPKVGGDMFLAKKTALEISEYVNINALFEIGQKVKLHIIDEKNATITKEIR